jgi:hypothetical protein
MLFNNKTEAQEKVNVESAYMIWRDLVDRNITIEHFSTLKNFIFDKDFRSYVERILKEYQIEIEMLSKTLNKFSIIGPDPNPIDQIVQVETEIFDDLGIAEVLHRFMRLDINLLMLSMKETPTNEEVYNLGRKLTEAAIKRIDDFIKFMKANNWLYLPPAYRHTRSEVPEKNMAAVNEIFLLHDHLIFRYNNISLTEILSLYVKDQMFNALLSAGIKILQSQVKDLEEKLLYYGVKLPKAYSNNTVDPKDKDMFEDRFIFNQILRGIQDAVALHGSAIQEVIYNDDLRKFFIKLTFDELSVLDKMIKLGKSKGWTIQTPIF